MKKYLARLLLFFIAVPLLVLMILYVPHRNNLAFNILAVVFSSLGALELRNILKDKRHGITAQGAVLLGGLGPLAATLSVSFNMTGELVEAAFALAAGAILISWVFASEKEISRILDRTCSGFSIILYPGFFLVFVIRMGSLEGASFLLLNYLILVLGSDALAWVSGVLFGKGNRGIIAVSPQKSIAGFIGSYIASVAFAVSAAALWPALYTSEKIPSLLAAVILGLVTGSAAIVGDLAESALKRSSNIKDSGAIIPGRGGVLDSIDSVALAAPVYYFLYRFLFL